MPLTQEYKAKWSLFDKLSFRLVFIYFMLYIFFMFTSSIFETPFKWIGATVLKITYEYDTSGYGSGDHTYAYVTLFINVILTLILLPIWTFLDQKRLSYNKLFYWFLVILRIMLVLTMTFYGAVKLFQIQFPQPNLVRLLEPLGNFSPMGLAWTYMGYSEGFNMFTGFMEVLGALLLIPRRTQTLGAFIVMGVMTHVAMMNYMFDIPVKLMSTHLVAMASVIFFTDIKRFTDVFFKNKSTTAIAYYHPINDKTYHHAIFWIKSFVLAIILISIYVLGSQAERKQGHKRQKPFLYGIWETSHYIKNNDTLPPLITDQDRWRYLILDYKDRATIKTMDDKTHAYHFIVDSSSKQLKIYKKDSDIGDFNIRYEHPNAYFLKLQGVIETDTLDIILHRKDLNDFILKSRGFRWINETPYNR